MGPGLGHNAPAFFTDMFFLTSVPADGYNLRAGSITLRGEAQKKECPCKMESSPLNIQRSLLGNVVVLPGILRRNLLCAESLMFLDLVHGGLSK